MHLPGTFWFVTTAAWASVRMKRASVVPWMVGNVNVGRYVRPKSPAMIRSWISGHHVSWLFSLTLWIFSWRALQRASGLEKSSWKRTLSDMCCRTSSSNLSLCVLGRATRPGTLRMFRLLTISVAELQPYLANVSSGRLPAKRRTVSSSTPMFLLDCCWNCGIIRAKSLRLIFRSEIKAK